MNTNEKIMLVTFRLFELGKVMALADSNGQLQQEYLKAYNEYFKLQSDILIENGVAL